MYLLETKIFFSGYLLILQGITFGGQYQLANATLHAFNKYVLLRIYTLEKECQIKQSIQFSYFPNNQY